MASQICFRCFQQAEERLDNVILKAMALNPKLRFQTIDAFMDAIVNKKRYDRPQVEMRKRRRHKNLAIASAVVIPVILVGALAVSQYLLSSNRGLNLSKIKEDTVTVWLIEKEYDEDITTLLKNNMEKECNNITLDIEEIPFNEYEEKIKEAVENDSLPDVFCTDFMSKEELEGHCMSMDNMKEREGFTYPLGEVEHEYSQTVPKGQIISQSPEANTTARTDEPISIVVSVGPEMVNMISVVYTSKEDAVSALEALGLTVKTTEDYSSSVEKGRVISQSIEAGTQVEKGSMVMLLISKGKRPQTQNNTSQTTQNDTAQTQQNLPQQTQQQVQPQQTQQSQPQQRIQSYSQDMTQDVHTYQDGSTDVGNIGVKQESIE